MKVDAVVASGMKEIAQEAVRLEAMGYDGLRLAELKHDPFMSLALAAAQTTRIDRGMLQVRRALERKVTSRSEQSL